MFLVTPPIDGEPAARHGPTVGFSVSGPDQAYAWHQAGIAAGGKAIEGKPGKRLGHRVNMFAAYLERFSTVMDRDGIPLGRNF